jgi:membrane-associated phospholipid phosphatase
MRPNLFVLLLFITIAACHRTNGQLVDSVVEKEISRKSLGKIVAAPVVFFSLGLYSKKTKYLFSNTSVYNWRNHRMPDFYSRADEYLQFVPAGMVYLMDVMGNRSKNDLLNRSLLLAKSELMMLVAVRVLKKTVYELRPDGNDNRSFPSGHTSQAFVAATFLHYEYGKKSMWYSVGGYAIASSVAVLRVLNNRHWTSDVLVGAGIGILSTNISYATHKYRWGKKTNLIVLPTYSKGPGFFLSIKV